MSNPSSSSVLALVGLTSVPKAIKGQSGNYWEIAAGPNGRSIYARFQFQVAPHLAGDTIVNVEMVQINVLYFGEEFEIPTPFQPLDQRQYEMDGEPVIGFILGKMFVPLGNFKKNLMELHQYVRDVASEAIQKSLSPLIVAAGCAETNSIKDLFAMLTEPLESEEKLLIKPKVYVNNQWGFHISNIKKASSAGYEAMKQKIEPPPMPPIEPNPDPVPPVDKADPFNMKGFEDAEYKMVPPGGVGPNDKDPSTPASDTKAVDPNTPDDPPATA